MFLTSHEIAQGAVEEVTSGSNTGEPLGAVEQLRIDDHVGAFHTSFIHRWRATDQPGGGRKRFDVGWSR
jgi:hypothetical protein